MYVTLLMDVEDLVAPESDDVARGCAEILIQEEAIATLCVVGQKARLLWDRGRFDVISSLNAHDLGLHTARHSIPPTVVEYLADKGWEDGVADALRWESPGVEAIREVFGVTPSCWGGAGNTWSPQICEAMHRCGIPAFVYSHTRVPEGGIHLFSKLISYPNGLGIDDSRYQDDLLAAEERRRVCARLEADAESGVFWQQVFLGHPTRLLHEEFWDCHNFCGGARTDESDWRLPLRKSQPDLERALVNFRRIVCAIRAVPGVHLVTIREMNQMLENAPAGPLTQEERDAVWPEIEANLRGMADWPILPRELDLSKIVELTSARMETLCRLDLSRFSYDL